MVTSLIPVNMLALLALLALGSLSLAGESDWPQFHGPHHNNTSPETGWNKDWPADGPSILWKRNVGRGLASFAIVGNRAYTSGNDGADTDTILSLIHI